jgi:hypothetical protein
MFSLSVDLHEYDPDEVSVRSEDNYLIVEAKHNQTGSRATRDLCRRTNLPNGIDPTKLSSTLVCSAVSAQSHSQRLPNLDDDADVQRAVRSLQPRGCLRLSGVQSVSLVPTVSFI